MNTNSQQNSSKPPFGVFLSTAVVMFFLTLSAADSVGFVPCQLDNTCAVTLADLPQLGINSDPGTNAFPAATSGILPIEIKISSVGIDLPVQNPDTTDLDTLDTLLNKGPAHYVDSADLGQSGNMIIFAHSSHLPIVTNKMFQAFNQIPNVDPGASIEVDGSDGKAYLYSVDSVVKADTNDTSNLLASQGTKLVLITCDNLSGTSARFILTADYVGVVNSSS